DGIRDFHVTGVQTCALPICYVPIRGGGIDWVAVTTARMKGWLTYSFGERTFRHHRKMGTAGSSELGARFHYGRKDYYLGGHPLRSEERRVGQEARSRVSEDG